MSHGADTIPTPKRQTKSRALAILLVGTLKDAESVSFPVWDTVDGRNVFVDYVASTHDGLEYLVRCRVKLYLLGCN
jgi:hypothetical protein